ncbi:MAG: DEAD/DEAH box helicase, partial [Nanoarchaeota archaeon]
MESFRKLGISEPILKILKEKGFEKPSEIQEKSIPPILAGKDVIAGASTGSGKTLAFGARLLQHSKKDFGIQALVLTPTRELAEQISNALYEFSQYDERDVVAIYGGVSMLPQVK